MEFELVYSPVALADLDQAWDEVYEASKDFDIADQYISDLRVKLKKICKRPKTGECLYYDGIFTGIYYVTHKKYSAFSVKRLILLCGFYHFLHILLAGYGGIYLFKNGTAGVCNDFCKSSLSRTGRSVEDDRT